MNTISVKARYESDGVKKNGDKWHKVTLQTKDGSQFTTFSQALIDKLKEAVKGSIVEIEGVPKPAYQGKQQYEIKQVGEIRKAMLNADSLVGSSPPTPEAATTHMPDKTEAASFTFRAWNREVEWKKAVAITGDAVLAIEQQREAFECYLQERREAHGLFMSDRIQKYKLHNMSGM